MGYRLVKSQIGQMLSLEGFVVRSLTFWLIRSHDVLLDFAHDLLDLSVEQSGQHNQKLYEPILFVGSSGHQLRNVNLQKG